MGGGEEESPLLLKGGALLLLLLVASELTQKSGDLRVRIEKLGGRRVENKGGIGRVCFNGDEHLCVEEEVSAAGAAGVWLSRYIFIGQADRKSVV